MAIWDCKTIRYFLFIEFYGYGQYDSAVEVPFPRKFSKLCLQLKLKFTQSILGISEVAKSKQ